MLVLIFFFREVSCDKWKIIYNFIVFTVSYYKQLYMGISFGEKHL